MKIQVFIEDDELKAFLGEFLSERAQRSGTARKAPGAALAAKPRQASQAKAIATPKDGGRRGTQPPAAIRLAHADPPLMAAIWAYCKRSDVDIHPGEIAHYFRSALAAGDDGRGNVIGATTPQADRHYTAIVETWHHRYDPNTTPSMAAMCEAIDALVPPRLRVRVNEDAA